MFCSPELEVAFWEHGTYLDPHNQGPPAFIEVSRVIGQVCRLTVNLYPVRAQGDDSDDENADSEAVAIHAPRRTVWVTTGLSRVCPSIIAQMAY